jgi:hypothetical protein
MQSNLQERENWKERGKDMFSMWNNADFARLSLQAYKEW